MSDETRPLTGMQLGYALTFRPREPDMKPEMPEPVRRVIKSSLGIVRFSGRCELYQGPESCPPGVMHDRQSVIMGIGLRHRSTDTVPTFEWWEAFTGIV